MYRALKAWGPAINGWPSRERSDFPTNFPDRGSGENHRRAKVPKKRGDLDGYPGGYAALNFCCWLYLPVTYLMMWRFVGLVEIFYWLVRDLTIEQIPLRVINKNPFQMGIQIPTAGDIVFIGPEHIFEIDLNTTQTRIHFTPCRTMHLYMHIHLSNIL